MSGSCFVSWRSFKHHFALGALFFLASFVYNLLCPLKKTIILSIPGASVESFVYLKFFFIAPGSLFLTSLFLTLSAYVGRKTLFRIFIGLFAVYFLLYTFVFHPHQSFWRLNIDAHFRLLSQQSVCIPLFQYWMESFFATAAELWGTTIVSLLIWGFVNQSMTHDQAQEKYVYLTLGINSSAIVSGWISLLIQKIYTEWQECFLILQIFLIVSIFFTWVLYEFLEIQGIFDSPLVVERAAKKTYATEKLSFFHALRSLWMNSVLWYIAALVIAYNTVYIFSDLLFVQQLKQNFDLAHQAESNQFLTYVSIMSGVFATFFALCVYPFIQKTAKWRYGALITPVIYTISALPFFLTLVSSQKREILGGYPAVILLGGLHVALLRGARYSVFDATKEMAYVGISKDDQIQGKSIIDTIVSRVGKSLGSFVIFLLLFFTRMSKIEDITFGIVLISLLLTAYWTQSVYSLDRLFRGPIFRQSSRSIGYT